MNELIKSVLNCDEAGATQIGAKMTAVYQAVLSSDDVRPEAVRMFPVIGTGFDSHTSIEYGEYADYGKAKIVANNADDIPQADIGRINRTATLYQVANHFRFSTIELEAALRSGAPLQTAKHLAAVKAQAEEIDRLFWAGDAGYGITGFGTFPLATVAVPADGTGNSALWSTKDAAKIARDLRAIGDAVSRATSGLRQADTLILSDAAYELAASTVMPNGLSALDMFKSSAPGITVVKSFALKPRGNADAVVMRKSEATAGIWMPWYCQLHPVQRDGLVLKTIVESRVAGLIVNDSKAIMKVTGLTA